LLPEFKIDPDDPPAETRPETPEEKARWERCLRLMLKPEDRARLERLLLLRLKEKRKDLDALWSELNGHWGYEDGFYRFYHGSFKVYGVQSSSAKAVDFLRSLLPERELNESFLAIIRDGTGKEFEISHNQDWARHTRPILEAFTHARYMVEMAVRYGDLQEPPQPLPSGYAALLYLYNLR
jgi:hypothetical protein